MKPIILLTAGTKEIEGLPKSIIISDYYSEYIRNAGGIPVIASNEKTINLYHLVKISGGLLLTGGGDPDPAYFSEPDENPGYIYDEKRDKMEFELIQMFMKEEKPIMGICRGFQMINIACGGSLHQDIYEKIKEYHPEGKDHYVCSKKGSWWEQVYGPRFMVNSFHHQTLNRIGKNLEVTAIAENTEIPEAIEHKYLPVYGVQWHPERMENMNKYVERFISDVDNCLAFHNRFV